MTTGICLLYMTAPDADEARRIGDALVAERLAACVNLIPGMVSVYRWQGEVRHDSEIVLIAKTRAELVERASARVRELHSYDCPCVVALPAAGGNPDFLNWIVQETTPD